MNSGPPVSRRHPWLLSGLLCASAILGWLVAAANWKAPVTPPALPPSTAQPEAGNLAKAPSPLANIKSWIQEIRNAGSPAQQTAAAAALASRLSRDQWPEVMGNLSLFSPDIVRQVLGQAIAGRWAEADPAGAAAWGLKSMDERLAVAGTAAAAWVRKDQAAATAWFEGLTDTQRSLAHTGFYSALAKKDPEACLQMILARQNSPGFKRYGWLLESLTSHNPQLAADIAQAITDPEVSKDFIRRAVNKMGGRDLREAVAWAQQQPDAPEMLKEVFRQSKVPPAILMNCLSQLSHEDQAKMAQECWVWWEQYKPAEMLAALKRAPGQLSSATVSSLIRRTISTMVRQDAGAARELLEKDWGAYANDWIPTLTSEWANLDPAAVGAWLEGLPPGPQKDKAMARQKEVAANRLQQQQRLEESPVDSSLRLLAVPTIYLKPPLATLQPQELQALWEKTGTLTDAQRGKAREMLIEFQSRHDPAEAASWISQEDPSPQTIRQASHIAATWVMNDAPAATAWAVALPEGETRIWAVWNLARQWNRIDPAAAAQWLEKIPDKSTRTLAADAFINKRPAASP